METNTTTNGDKMSTNRIHFARITDGALAGEMVRVISRHPASGVDLVKVLSTGDRLYVNDRHLDRA